MSIESIDASIEKQRGGGTMDATWMYVYCASLFVSCIATMLATYHMRQLGGDMLRSTVRFVIGCFLISSALHALAGGCFYSFLIAETRALERKDALEAAAALVAAAANATTASSTSSRSTAKNVVAMRLLHAMGSSDHDDNDDNDDSDAISVILKPDNNSDGAEAAYISKLTHDARPLSPVLTTFLLLENLFFVLSAYWIVLVTLELFKLAMATLDRGMAAERKTIRRHVVAAAALLLGFIVVAVPIVIVHDGYNRAYRFMGMLELAAIIVSVLYAARSLVVLRRAGRKHEHIHGMLLASPLYQRLKRLLIVCIVFTLPYCFLQLTLLGLPPDHIDSVPDYLVGIATMLYYLFGAAQALVMGGSQQCCLRILSPIIPAHIRTSPEWIALRASRRHGDAIDDEATAAPLTPVFVVTDIEASSALWATAPPDVIDRAQQLHDDLLRSCLPKYRGYEITTVGDSFQLAFHSMQDAVEYALETQLLLLHAKWPSALDGLVPASKTEWAIDHLKPHTIFRGLRVRMGIHDTNIVDDGQLVPQIHLVTGKTLYIGASELIARELGDAGFGGQVLVTKRVAAWLRAHLDAIATPCRIDYVGVHAVQQLEMDVEVFEVTPKALDGRRRVFRKRRGLDESQVNDAAGAITHSESTADESVGAAGTGIGGSEYKRQRTPTAAIRAGLAAVGWRKAGGTT